MQWVDIEMETPPKGPFKCYVMQIGVGVSNFPGKSITKGWVGVQFPEKSIT